MENVTFNLPTVINVGEDATLKVIDTMSLNQVKKCMLHYGGGSIKRNGAYDDVTSALKAKQIEFVEFGGQLPNPRYQIAHDAMDVFINNGCDAILSVGGGSILDSSKYIAIGATILKNNPDADVWNYTMEEGKGPMDIPECFPVYSVMTLSATGSESNFGGVISRLEDGVAKKYGFMFICCRPVASALVPQYQNTLPPFQTASGALDMMSHLIESYQNMGKNTNELPMAQMSMIEGLLDTVRVRIPQLLEDPKNLHARTDIMWTGYMALNHVLHVGAAFGGDWTTHMIEHAVSALADVTHGIGLAVIHPGLWRFMEKHAAELTEGQRLMMQRLREKIFGGAENMEAVVAQWREMLRSWNMPTTLPELIQLQRPEMLEKHSLPELIRMIAENTMQRPPQSFYPFTVETLCEVLELSCQ